MFRTCTLGILLAVFTCSIVTAAPTLLTPAQTKQAEAVVDALLKAGFPDTKGATVYTGKLAVSATYDPAKDAPPLPSEASNTQMTSDTALVTYGYEFGGLHFKLADGSWLISMRFHFTPGRDDKVDFGGATEVDLTKLSADADAQGFDAATKAKKYLDREAAASRPLATRVMNRCVPVTNRLNLNSDELAPAAVMLSRAGWADGLDLSLAAADQRCRRYWQMRPWTGGDYVFDPTGKYPQSKTEEAAFDTAHPQFTPEPPDVALRRAMFRWCRGQMMETSPEDAMLPADVALATTKAMVDPGDPQHNLPRVDQLAAGAKLPVTPAENVPLPDRLQSWEARPRQPKMVVTGGNNGGANAQISTSFNAPAPAYEPVPADLDALVALLGDDRPSRMNDFAGGRTLGDNAWRGLAVLLKADPRTLANYPVDHPWTDAERHTAAAAVQKWWKGHRANYVKP